MEEYEGRIEWTKYLNIIWKRKWIIIIPAILCAVVAGVFSFLQSSEWEVTAIIQPGMFFVFDTEKKAFETEQRKKGLIIEGDFLAGQINEGYYNDAIATELNLNLAEVPNISASKLRWTESVAASIKTPNVKKAKIILHSLFTIVKNEIDTVLESADNTSDAQVASYENIIEIETQGIHFLETELSQMDEEINALKKTATENLAQAQMRMLLSDKKKDKRTIKADIEEKRIMIEQAKIKINSLNQKKGQINYTQLIREPTSTLHPVAPRKTYNMVIAGFLGFIIFVMFAFFVEYIESIKSKP